MGSARLLNRANPHQLVPGEVTRIFETEALADSLVIRDPTGALPYTKLTRCSLNCSSVTMAVLAPSRSLESSGRSGARFKADFRSAMSLSPTGPEIYALAVSKS